MPRSFASAAPRAWKLVIGEFAEVGEGTLPVEVLVCEECRHMEFRLLEGVR